MERVFLPPHGHPADANARLRHPAERAAWIWHPDVSAVAPAVLRFRRHVVLAEAVTALLHVTADQRFQLRCDGRELTFGPDRCDVEHWTVHTLRLTLDPGVHDFEALVWWLPGVAAVDAAARETARFADAAAPMAQMSWRGGFLLAAEGVPADLLDTGRAEWLVADLTAAVSLTRVALPGYHDVGPSFTFDLGRWPASAGGRLPGERPAVVAVPPLRQDEHGVRRPGWCLYPADLPEQRREHWSGGVVRAVRDDDAEVPWRDGTGPVAFWQGLVDGTGPIIVPPYRSVTVLWDLGRYRCAYPDLVLRTGAGASARLDWAESLYEEAVPGAVTPRSRKGRRDLVEGKVFRGFGDAWECGPDGGREVTVPALWWRSGRYVRLRVATAAAPLAIVRLGLRLTGYPLQRAGRWTSSDASWDRLMPLFENSYRVSAHETWTDSPYYEQMCYVGDALLSARSNYAWFADDRLSRRALRLCDWSRQGSGLVAERYPSARRQESGTYALLWPLMIRDFAWWRDDPAFVRDLIPGMRALLAVFDRPASRDGLLGRVPGWAFVDWVRHWPNGCGPGVVEGDSSIVNLHWVLALQAAADVERAYGDPRLAGYADARAREVFAAILRRFWDGRRGLLRDTGTGPAASEHAQAYALLTGLLDADHARACLATLDSAADGTAPEMAMATISSSHHVLEAFYRYGRVEAFHRRLAFWRDLPDQGFTATPEAPEPSRSDAHAWGSHPAWHTLATIAGIRPGVPGYASVRIAAMPGPLTFFEARSVHPLGCVDVVYRRDADGGEHYDVTLPPGVDGLLVAAGKTHRLPPGSSQVDLH